LTADRDSLRFYVDESALGIGKTLAAARKDTIHVGHALIPECGYGALDTEWIPAVATRGLIVIGRDKHIRTRPQELRRLRDAELRVFRIGGKKDLSTWEWLRRLVNHWDDMEEIIRTRGPGPWFYLINDHNIVEVELPAN
jgi:hypothetical protein